MRFISARRGSSQVYQRDNGSCHGNPFSSQVLSHRHVYTYSHGSFWSAGSQKRHLPADLRFGLRDWYQAHFYHRQLCRRGRTFQPGLCNVTAGFVLVRLA